MNNINKITGLTWDEQNVMNDILECNRNYLKLEKQHPDDIKKFTEAVHIIQGLLALRIVRREYPQLWG